MFLSPFLLLLLQGWLWVTGWGAFPHTESEGLAVGFTALSLQGVGVVGMVATLVISWFVRKVKSYREKT